MITRLSFCLLLTTALSSCALFNPYEQPVTEAPPAWAISDGQAAAAATIPTDWWQGFQQPQLTALVDEALQHNFDLEAAVARVREADAQARIAGAPLLPSLNATADATRSKNGTSRSGSFTDPNTGTTTTIGGSSSINNSYSARLNASYELDFWGRNFSSYQAASALADASRFDQQTVRLTVAADTATTYFAIISLQERIRIAQENLAAAEGLLDAINRRASVGLVSGLDVAQQENAVATLRAVLPGLEQQLSQNLNALAILVGQLPENIDLPGAQPLASITAPVVAPGLPSTLLSRRPDVQNAEAQLVAAHANINNARAAFFPVINLTASGGSTSDALNSLFRNGNFAWSLGTGLTQPIFQGGALFGQLAYSHAREDELLALYKKAVASSFADVENALAARTAAEAQVNAQADAARSAREAFTLSQRQFDSGIIDITTLLNAQRSLFSAQDALAQAQQARLAAAVGLYQALGGGFNATARD